MTYPNGDKYQGQFQNEKPHGNGKMTDLDGSFYEGMFANGTPANPNAHGQLLMLKKRKLMRKNKN